MRLILDIDWVGSLGRAWKHRESIESSKHTDSWRLFHGYEEGAKGVVIEKFGTMAIVEFKDDIRDQLPLIRDVLLSLFPFSLIIAKGKQSIGLSLRERMFALHGDFNQATEFASEYGVFYALQADAIHNCGLYVDARPVRRWLLDNSKDLRILNLFAFVGSLGIAALKGGAREVVHLDKSKALLPRIKRSYGKNDLKFDERNFLQGDIYKHLPKAIKHKQFFDGIILDPPPKVYKSPHSKHQPKGQDFSSLVKYCSKLLNSGGWLICLFHRFDSTWDESDLEIIQASGGTLDVSERFTSECDFPESDIENKLRVTIFKKHA